MSKLSFEWKDRDIGANQNPVRHRGFVVDGVAIEGHLLRRAKQTFDYVSPFGWLDESLERATHDQLLGKANSELESGRVPILICPECADLGCGCVSVFVEFNDDTVTWHGFAYENNYEPKDTMELEGMPRFSFPRAEYEAALDSLRRWSE